MTVINITHDRITRSNLAVLLSVRLGPTSVKSATMIDFDKVKLAIEGGPLAGRRK